MPPGDTPPLTITGLSILNNVNGAQTATMELVVPDVSDDVAPPALHDGLDVLWRQLTAHLPALLPPVSSMSPAELAAELAAGTPPPVLVEAVRSLRRQRTRAAAILRGPTPEPAPAASSNDIAHQAWLAGAPGQRPQ